MVYDCSGSSLLLYSCTVVQLYRYSTAVPVVRWSSRCRGRKRPAREFECWGTLGTVGTIGCEYIRPRVNLNANQKRGHAQPTSTVQVRTGAAAGRQLYMGGRTPSAAVTASLNAHELNCGLRAWTSRDLSPSTLLPHPARADPHVLGEPTAKRVEQEKATWRKRSAHISPRLPTAV